MPTDPKKPPRRRSDDPFAALEQKYGLDTATAAPDDPFAALEAKYGTEAATPAAPAPAAPTDPTTPQGATRQWGAPKPTLLDRAKDVGIAAVKGAIALPEAAVGLADLAMTAQNPTSGTTGHVGRLAERLGFEPKRAKQVLDSYLSPAQQEANAAVQNADGIVGTLRAAVENPSTIVQGAVESAPSMLGGAGLARGGMALLGKAAPQLAAAVSPMLAGAAGEGAVAAGTMAEGVRQQSPTGLLTTQQAGLAAGSGALTGALSVLGGRIAQRWGFTDVDALLAGARRDPQLARHVARDIVGGMVQEGVLEEAPQSLQEQIATNLATGRPWDEGVAQATTMGGLIGAVMGGGGQVIDAGGERVAATVERRRAQSAALPRAAQQAGISAEEWAAMEPQERVHTLRTMGLSDAEASAYYAGIEAQEAMAGPMGSVPALDYGGMELPAMAQPATPEAALAAELAGLTADDPRVPALAQATGLTPEALAELTPEDVAKILVGKAQQAAPVAPPPAAPAAPAVPSAAPVATPAPEAPAAPVTFRTERGSRYQVEADGTTTRDKARRAEHGDDAGPQPQSERTVYVDKAGLDALSFFDARNTSGHKQVVLSDDGRIGIRYTSGPDAGKVVEGTVAQAHTTPAAGLYPVELWDDGRRVHFGNEITEVGDAAPVAQPASTRASASRSRVRDEPLTNLDVEPERFQYKGNTDAATGAGVELKSVRRWDPNMAGVVLTWRDPADGRLKVVNGHHRVDLARRLNVPAVTIREVEASDAAEARTIGALVNIAEGRGTAIDAAKVFRALGATTGTLEQRGISLKGAVARDGLALARLHPTLFAEVAAERMPVQRAVVIGASGLEPEQQLGLLQMLRQREDKGKSITNDALAELIRFTQGAGTADVTQESLFGTETMAQSLAVEKAQLSAHVKDRLAKDRRLFGFLAKGDRAGRIEGAGVGKVAVDKAQNVAGAAAQMEEVYSRLSGMRGPVADALNDAARQWAQGANRDAVRQELYTAVRAAVEAELRALTGEPGAQSGRPAGADRGRDGEGAGAGVDDAEQPVAPFVDPDQIGFIGERTPSYDPLQSGLFGDEPRPAAPQESLFGGKEGTEASRSLAEAERAARAELAEIETKLPAATPAKRLRMLRRQAELERLVNRGRGIAPAELARRLEVEQDAEPIPGADDEGQRAFFERQPTYEATGAEGTAAGLRAQLRQSVEARGRRRLADGWQATQRPEGWTVVDRLGAVRGEGVPAETEAEAVGRIPGSSTPRIVSEQEQPYGEAFWRWFGGSKIVDAEGRPAIATHFSHSTFDTFSHEERSWRSFNGEGLTTGYGRQFVFPRKGFFFFVGETPKGSHLGPVRVDAYLSIQNPIDLRVGLSPEDASALIDAAKRTFSGTELPGHTPSRISGHMIVGGLRRARKEGMTPQQLWEFIDYNIPFMRSASWDWVLDALGKDGVIFESNSSGTALLEPYRGRGDGETYLTAVAREPHQIKSATDNDGTFDADDPRIVSEPARPYDPDQGEMFGGAMDTPLFAQGDVQPTSIPEDVKSAPDEAKPEDPDDVGPAAVNEATATYAAGAPVTSWWYSRLGRAIEAGPAKATADQWRAHLSKGVAKAEREWVGLDRLFALRPTGAIPKADVLRAFRQGEIRLGETVLRDGALAELHEDLAEYAERDAVNALEASGLPLMRAATIARYARYETRPWRRVEDLAVYAYGEDHGITFTDAARAAVDEVRKSGEEARAARRHPARYKKYTEPGGENYREILITLDTPTGDAATNVAAAKRYIERTKGVPSAEEAYGYREDGEYLALAQDLGWRPSLPDGYTVERFQGGWSVFGPDGAEVASGPTDDEAVVNARERIGRRSAADPLTAMSRDELDAEYEHIVGHRPLAENPGMSTEELRAMVRDARDIFFAEGEDAASVSTRPAALGYRSRHFPSVANPLVHMRVTDRYVNGEEVLFIEEIQSDWHQAGRSQGYGEWTIDERTPTPDNAFRFVATRPGHEPAYGNDRDGLEYVLRVKKPGVPDAPFKKTQEWVGLAVRRLLAEAVAGGQRRIAWTSGEMQAQRFDLSKQVDAIEWQASSDGETVSIAGMRDDYEIASPDPVPPQELDGVVGKGLATRIRDAMAKGEARGEFSGDDLKVGGFGLRAFYDEMLPNIIRDELKALGVRAEIEPIIVADEVQAIAQRLDEIDDEIDYDNTSDTVALQQAVHAVVRIMRRDGSTLEDTIEDVIRDGPALTDDEAQTLREIAARAEAEARGRRTARSIRLPDGLADRIRVEGQRVMEQPPTYQADEEPSPMMSGLHNLTPENLYAADALGGLPAPSVAVVPEAQGFDQYGEITLILDGSAFDPAENPTFDADAYTGRAPQKVWKPRPTKEVQKLVNRLRPAMQDAGDNSYDYGVWDNLVGNPSGKHARPDQAKYELLRSDGAKLAFLREHGVPLARMERTVTNDGIAGSPALKAFFEEHGSASTEWWNTPNHPTLTKLKRAIRTAAREQAAKHPDVPRLAKVWTERLLGEDGTGHFGSIARLLDDVARVGRTEMDREGMREAIAREIASRQEAFEAWVDALLEPHFQNPLIRDGGRAKPWTLDNVTDAMVRGRQIAGVEDTMTHGPGKVRAVGAKRFTSADDARTQARTQIKSPEEVRAATEAIGEAARGWRDRLLDHYRPAYSRGAVGDTWEGLDEMHRALAAVAKNRMRRGVTPALMRAALAKHDFRNIPDELVQESLDMLRRILEAPTDYFEGKPQRAVRFDEVAGAVIPEDAPARVRDILEKRGVPIATYPRHDGEKRQQATTDLRRTLYRQGRRVLMEPVNAYHGTPHRFDRFSTDHVGSGEGAQAYGWGLYFAGKREIAEFYRDKLSSDRVVPLSVLRDYFKPGRIVPGYGGYDRVVKFTEGKDSYGEDTWSVTVRAVEFREGRWQPERSPSGTWDRTHKTMPKWHEIRRALGTVNVPRSEDYGANKFFINGVPEYIIWQVPDYDARSAAAMLSDHLHWSKDPTKGLANAIAAAEQIVANAKAEPGRFEKGSEARLLEQAEALLRVKDDVELAPATEPPGALFEVGLPDDQHMLVWDTPISEQPAYVQQALAAAGIELGKMVYPTYAQAKRLFEGPTAQRLAAEDVGIRRTLAEGYALLRQWGSTPTDAWDYPAVTRDFRRWIDAHGRLLSNTWKQSKTGQELYDTLVREASQTREWKDAPKAASERLLALGIPGIRYLDGSSRSTGALRVVEVAAGFQLQDARGRNPDGVTYGSRAEAERALAEQPQASYNYVIFDGDKVQIQAVMERVRPRYADPAQGDLFATTPGGEQVPVASLPDETAVAFTPKQTAQVAQALARLEAAGLPLVRDRAAGVAAARAKDFAAIDLRGRPMRSAEERALVMQALRHPAFEVLTVFYLDDNDVVVGHESTSSGALQFSKLPDNWEETIGARAQQLGATRVIFGHNHPSGDPAPSDEDYRVTAGMGYQLQQRGIYLVGHVVINHDRAAWISPRNNGLGHDLFDIPPDTEAPWRTAPQAGHPLIDSSTSAARALQAALDPTAVTVAYLDNQQRIIAVAGYDAGDLATIDQWLPETLSTVAGRKAVVAVPMGSGYGLASRVQEREAGPRSAPHWGDTVLDVMEVGSPSSTHGLPSIWSLASHGHINHRFRRVPDYAAAVSRTLGVREGDAAGRRRVDPRESGAGRDASRVPARHGVVAEAAPPKPAFPPDVVAAAFAHDDIDFSGEAAKAANRRRGSLRDHLNRFADAIANGYGAIERLGETVEGALPPTRNPRDLLTTVKNSDYTVARFMNEGVVDPETREVVGPSFKALFARFARDPERIQIALKYVKAERDVGRGLAGMGGDEAAFARAEERVKIGRADPDLVAFAADWRAFVEGIGAYAVKSGLWTPALWDRLRDSDALYVRYKRILAPDVREAAGEVVSKNPGAAAKRMVNVGPGVQRFEGSKLPIQNPAEAMAEYVGNIVRRADRYRVGAALFDVADAMGSEGVFLLTRIKAADAAARAKTPALRERAKDLFLDDATLEALLDTFDVRFDPDNPVIWRNNPHTGTKEYAQVNSPELWRAVAALHATDDSALRTVLNYTVRPLKRVFVAATTGLSPRFALGTNPVRDLTTLAAQSRGGMRPADIVLGYAHGFLGEFGQGRSHLAAEAKAWGLGNVSLYRNETAPAAVARRVAPTTRATKLRTALVEQNPVTLAVHGLERVGDASDKGPRLAEYLASLRRNQHRVTSGEWTLADLRLRAATEARPVTIDFANKPGNAVMRFFADYIPFFGPAVQAPVVLTRAAVRNPKRVAGVAAAVTLATMIAWSLKYLLDADDDGERLPELINDRPLEERAAYLLVPIDPRGGVLRVPLPQEFGFLSSVVTATLDRLVERDPQAGRLVATATVRLLPPGITEVLKGVPPLPGLQQVAENQQNRRIYGDRPIEPRSMERLPVAERRRETTPPTFDMLAAGARAAGFESISPLKAEHLVRGVTSSATPLLTTALDPIASRVTGRPTPRGTGQPISQSALNPASVFVRKDPPTATQAEDIYYDLRARAQQARALASQARRARDRETLARARQDFAAELRPAVGKRFAQTDRVLDGLRDREARIRARRDAGTLPRDEARQQLAALRATRQRVLRTAVRWLRERGVTP